ncbi:hypothetical protein Glove_1g32 [Diversispora epigaea]|uniref:Uncharacterized protein n=1 Tax=Diversispora epigaea TaxID=1348612 RepID=A0A397JTG9_9GLOM|nr:hypothetical protein Glove_1g32 [Diversispora epigaea]
MKGQWFYIKQLSKKSLCLKGPPVFDKDNQVLGILQNKSDAYVIPIHLIREHDQAEFKLIEDADVNQYSVSKLGQNLFYRRLKINKITLKGPDNSLRSWSVNRNINQDNNYNTKNQKDSSFHNTFTADIVTSCIKTNNLLTVSEEIGKT